MFLSLPNDVIWIIFKCYLKDIVSDLFPHTSLHEFLLYSGHRSNYRTEKTYVSLKEIGEQTGHYLIDFLYPLRLVCTTFDMLIRKKVIKDQKEFSHVKICH
jgi:hypothetical protein